MDTLTNKPLNDAQISLLNLIGHGISDEDIVNIRKIIVQYLNQKAITEADKLWAEKNWSAEDAQRIVNDPEQ
jgi:hypothetical protein